MPSFISFGLFVRTQFIILFPSPQQARRVILGGVTFFDLINRTSDMNEGGYTLHYKESMERNGQQFINAGNGL